MKLIILPIVLFVVSGAVLGQDGYPVATPTDRPDIVISPYDSTRRLDVAGLSAGSLAKDPVAGKVFRIPGPNDMSAPLVEEPNGAVPPPPVEPTEAPLDLTNERSPAAAQLPPDLLNFIYAFNQNSTVNDPDALLPFYAATVENYFGRKNVSRSDIRADRSSYMNRFPNREYILDGAPVLVSQNGNLYEVMTRVRYTVSGSSGPKSGTVSDFFKIRRGSRQFEIVSIREAKAEGAEIPQPQEILPRGTNSVYSRYEQEQIHLFLEAFAASGEVNEPSSMIDFMHPQISEYYDKARPSVPELLEDRINYINRWPERKYWLAEKPVVTPVRNGVWEAVVKTGYEVKNGTKISNGVSTSDIRLTYTSGGLKILSIRSR